MTPALRLAVLTWTVCLCCGEDVDFAQDYRPVLPFCKLLCLGELSQVPESGSCEEVSAGPHLQSHWPTTRTADEMRLGLRRQAYWAQYARALHYMPQAAGGISREEFQS